MALNKDREVYYSSPRTKFYIVRHDLLLKIRDPPLTDKKYAIIQLNYTKERYPLFS